MNSQEKKYALKLARVVRTARKQSGLSQVELSQSLGMSQSNLSKIEHGINLPSAPVWIEFCRIAGISPTSLTLGYIESNAPVNLTMDYSGEQFRIPKKYAQYRGSKARALLPFFNYFETVHGPKKTAEFIKAQKMDPDFFTNLDNQINLNFLLDISRHLIQSGGLKSRDISKLIKPVSQPEMHGSLHSLYDREVASVRDRSSLRMIQLIVSNAKFYESNFKYEIQNDGKDWIDMSITPEAHLATFDYRKDPVLGDFLCQYKKNYFQQFANYDGHAGATVEEKECHYRDGAGKCVYRYRIAG